jgi:outer membrane protein assembly factor BamB
MFKRLLVLAAGVSILGIATFAVLYSFFGLRIRPDGTLIPAIEFVKSPSDQERAIEAHREAQRAAAPATPAGASPEPAAAPGQAASPAATFLWPGYRGAERDGRYRDTPIRTDWSRSGLQALWKQPVGGGYASFALARGRAFTIEQRGRNEVVAAYDVLTGRELWKDSWPAFFQESMGGDGPRATPAWDGGKVYALGAAGELRAYDDATGKVVWRANILKDAGASNLTWGMAASPLIAGDAVIVLPGGGDGRSVTAYDKNTGKILWSALNDPQSYAAPMLVTLAGTRQFLVVSATRIMGLSLDRRDVLWEQPWRTEYDINAAQPIVIGDNRVFYSSGYGVGAAVFEISRDGDRFAAREIWRNNRMKNRASSSVLHNGFIYGLDEAILACIDAATGELKWKGGRYGYGQLLVAGDHLVVITDTGDLVLVAAAPDEHRELARFPAIAGKTWNVPALVGGILLVRNAEEMAAFDLRVSAGGDSTPARPPSPPASGPPPR